MRKCQKSIGSIWSIVILVLRPTTVPRHTYANIKATGIFTLNAITDKQIADAHHTSAKYPAGVSEFDQTDLVTERKKNWNAPFVQGAPIQLGCRYQNEYFIKENDTIMVVASIVDIYISEPLLLKDGWVQLDQGNIVSINGLDGYTAPQLLERFPYARPKS